MPLFAILALLGLAGAGAAVALKKKGPAGGPSAAAPLKLAQWYRVTLTSTGPIPSAPDPLAVLKQALLQQGFYVTAFMPSAVDTSKGGATVAALGHYQGPPDAALGAVPSWTVVSTDQVAPPPQTVQSQMTPPSLDPNLPVPTAQAVQNALAFEKSTVSLVNFSSLMLPEFPAAAAVLKTQGGLLSAATNPANLPSVAPAVASGLGPDEDMRFCPLECERFLDDVVKAASMMLPAPALGLPEPGRSVAEAAERTRNAARQIAAGHDPATISTGAESAYAQALAAVGLHPDNPDQMYAQLMGYIKDPVRFKNADKNWRGARDNKIWWEDPKGIAALQWPFHGGRWLDNVPKNEAQTRAVFKIPAGVGTKQFLAHLWGFPYRADLRYSIHWQEWKQGGGGFFDDLGSSVSHMADDVGHAVDQVATQAAHSIDDAIKVIPEPFKAIVELTPVGLVDAVAKGGDIMTVAKRFVDSQADAYKQLAPYVEAAVAVIPGIGPEVSSSIALGAALAEGKPISDAALDAAAAALPGGMIVKEAFKASVAMGSALAQGKNIGDAALDGMRAAVPAGPLRTGFDAAKAIAQGKPPAQAVMDSAANLLPAGPARDAALSASHILGAAAAGKPVDQAVLAELRSHLPAGPAQAAFDAASSVAQGKTPAEAALTSLAQLAPQGPAREAALSAARVAGRVASGTSLEASAMQEARDRLPAGAARNAFDTGMALSHAKSLQDVGFAAARNLLPGDAAQQSMAFAQAVTQHGVQGVADVLEKQLASQVAALGPDAAKKVHDAVGRIVSNPALAKLTSTDLAKKLGNLAEPIARAALASISVPSSISKPLNRALVLVKTGRLDKIAPNGAPKPVVKASALSTAVKTGPKKTLALAMSLKKAGTPGAMQNAAELENAARLLKRAELVRYYLSLGTKAAVRTAPPTAAA